MSGGVYGPNPSALQKMGIAGGGLLALAVVTILMTVTWVVRGRRRAMTRP